ncbi:hypothetical protein PF672P2_00047 [Parabacteroides phage PF672P2]|nr:hypothetical protein PF672P2_00047 [Parabacteroides phage PF672P2]
MNKRKKVLSYKNLPAKLPTYQALVTFLACDVWNAPSWLYGVFGCFWAGIFLFSIIGFLNQEQVEI